MKKLFSTTIIALSIFTVGVLLSSTGCRKKKDTIAKIYVYDASNVPVVGAQVVLFGEPSTPTSPPVVLFDTTTTNGSGEAIFNFNDVYQLGQAGVAVLNIDARKDAMTGEGIIKVEQETTSEESVFIAP
ncbi:MAG: hypothetical protein IT221_09320 [Fluviicola sp.]|nr:hypothetical protein [Fluviicola sp.]